MSDFTGFVGLDVHKDTIAVALAGSGRGEVEYLGEVRNDAGVVKALRRRLGERAAGASFCYEAGPCGYVLYRELLAAGYDCEVVAPSLIPRKVGERVKTDRRDSLKLARMHRAGELTPVWVPREEDEAIRDLVRAREDLKAIELKARQRLGAFLLRHGRVYREGKSRWTQRHFEWLGRQRFASPVQQSVHEEYLDTVRDAQARVRGLEARMREALQGWCWRAVVEGLMALRGVDLITAMTVVAELGDLSRFDSPRQLMAYLGLVPSEHSSGARRRPGAITKTGNGHVRRVLIEAAWAYRFPPRKTAHLRRKAAAAPKTVQALAWAAQRRLCARYRHLYQAGKAKPKVCVALARELVGFIWAIACEVQGKPHASRALLGH